MEALVTFAIYSSEVFGFVL